MTIEIKCTEAQQEFIEHAITDKCDDARILDQPCLIRAQKHCKEVDCDCLICDEACYKHCEDADYDCDVCVQNEIVWIITDSKEDNE